MDQRKAHLPQCIPANTQPASAAGPAAQVGLNITQTFYSPCSVPILVVLALIQLHVTMDAFGSRSRLIVCFLDFVHVWILNGI